MKAAGAAWGLGSLNVNLTNLKPGKPPHTQNPAFSGLEQAFSTQFRNPKKPIMNPNTSSQRPLPGQIALRPPFPRADSAAIGPSEKPVRSICCFPAVRAVSRPAGSPAPLLMAFFVFLVVCGMLPLSGCSGRKGGEGKAESGPGQNQPGKNGGKGVKEDKDSASKEFLTPVVVEKAARGPMLVTISTTANVIPVRSESIQCMESGILVFTKAWEEGDRVDSGTLIATLDNEDLRKQNDTAKADLNIQRQTLDIQRIRQQQAEREYVIVQDLYSRGLAPLKDVESSKLALENARNSLRQTQINQEKARLALEQIQERFQFLDIRAPFPGLLVSRSTIQGRSGFAKTFGSERMRILEGRYVAKSTDLFGVIDTSKVILKCDVTSKDIAKVHVGQEAQGVVYGRENIEVQGKVVSVSGNVNPDTRAFEVEVLVDNPDTRLLPGMFGRMEIVVQRLEDVIAVMKTVVQRRGEKDVVFVVDRSQSLPHPLAKITTIELGVESKDRVEIKNGLRNNDEVVVRGYEILQDQIPLQVAYADEPTS